MDNSDHKAAAFKRCPTCGFEWGTRKAFLRDPDVKIIGYQVHFKDLTKGFFLFNHSCGGTFGIQVDGFADLYRGPIFKTRATGSDECPEYCLRQEELKPCPVECECAYVREIIQIVQKWEKG